MKTNPEECTLSKISNVILAFTVYDIVSKSVSDAVVEVSFAAGVEFSKFSKVKQIRRQSKTKTKLGFCILL